MRKREKYKLLLICQFGAEEPPPGHTPQYVYNLVKKSNGRGRRNRGRGTW